MKADGSMVTRRRRSLKGKVNQMDVITVSGKIA